MKRTIIFFSILVFTSGLILYAHIFVGSLFVIGVFFCAFLYIKRAILLLILFLFLILGIARGYIWNKQLNSIEEAFEIFSLVPDHVLSGKIVDVERNSDYQRIYFRLYSARIFDVKPFKNRVILIYLPLYPQYRLGDELKLKGEIQVPSFLYVSYYRSREVLGLIYFPKVISVTETSFLNIFFIKKMRQALNDRLNILYTEPYSALLSGLLIGGSEGIKSDLKKAFIQSGLSHIMVVSGYNVTLVILFTHWILQFFCKKIRLFGALLMVVFFVLIVGAQPPAARAAIMGSLGLIGMLYERRISMLMCILIAAFLMILYNPTVLFYDDSFKLSFLATIGVVYLAPLINKRLILIIKNEIFSNIISVILGAQLFVGPFLFWRFGQFSFLTPLANLFMVPFLPLAMVIGFLALLASLVSIEFGYFVAYFGLLPLRMIVEIVYLFGT